MDNINNETEALRACSEEFIADIQREYGLDIHHVEVTLRKNSCIRAETANGDSKVVPALNIYFLDESFSKVIDDRKQLKTDMTDKIRKMWQEATIPYKQYLNKKECCDPHMYIHASDFEQKCFYDFVSGRQKEIVELLNSRLGGRPERVYPALEGVNIVYTKADYEALEIETKAESLREEIYAMADRYMCEKYQQKINNVSYIRFMHPEMPGYNGYGLWLG